MPAWLASSAQLGVVLAVLALAYVPLGDHLARTFTSPRHLRVEKWAYRIIGADPEHEQRWTAYAVALLAFSFVSVALLYVLLRGQAVVPGNGGLGGVDPAVAFNTAVSFATNTDWQSYTPETTIGVVTSAIGLTVANMVSAAAGLVAAAALVRGLASRRGDGLVGNLWVDLVRGVVRVLLPLSLIVAVLLLSEGVVQSVSSGWSYVAIDGTRQHVVTGLFASQEAIKEVGTNGGGMLGANSAHPFENPTPLTNVIEIVAMLVIPVSLTRAYGTMVGDRRQGHTILGVMATLFGLVFAAATWFETRPAVAGAAMEGKELRFGVPASVLFGVATTGTSTGAVNSAHESWTAGGGGALLWNMLLGEVAPGGVGSGLYGMLVLAIVAVFVGGLLVGRGPELLGKRIGQREITVASLSVLVMPALVLVGVGASLALGATRDAVGTSGAPGTPAAMHGYSEVLYAYASAANNNGSAFGGLTATSSWFQTSLGLAMLFGRFVPIVCVLALAGLFARQRPAGTVRAVLPTRGLLFGGLLFGTAVLVAGLTFVPALALGPIAEAMS